jgi:hypothetical protein
MRTLVAAIFSLILSHHSLGQRDIDIRLESQNQTACQLVLLPNFSQTGILSSLVFTVRWRANQAISLGTPQMGSTMALVKSGPVHISGGWKYQIYSGLGFISIPIGQPISITIPKSGTGKVSLTSDPYIEQLNGEYYVAVGGEDVTGVILTQKQLEIQEFPDLEVTLYLDPATFQFYIKREKQYYDLLGQKVTIRDEERLLQVRKNESQ